MRITLIDGTYEGNKDNVGKNFVDDLTKKGHRVTYLQLAKMDIAYCQGCWSCWVATPGRCVHKDDTEILLRETIQADLVVHITENKFGTVTSLTKKSMDKSIPLVHPYIIIENGISVHKKRYRKFPKWGFIVIDAKNNGEDFQKITDFFEKVSLVRGSTIQTQNFGNRSENVIFQIIQ